MPIAVDGKVYDDEFQYKMDSIGIKPVQSDPLDYTDQYNTELSPKEQSQYNQKFSPGDSYDYDMQGWFKANPDANPNEPGVHYPDTFKKPNHPTFSDESQYHGVDGFQGGSWGKENGKDYFIPGPTNLQNHGAEGLQQYFKKTEPTIDLRMPPQGPTEPAGALKPSEGTGIPAEVPETNFVHPTPDYINPPESTMSFRPSMIGMIKGLGETAKEGVLAPGEAWQGKLPMQEVDPITGETHTSLQAIEKANALAGLMVFGPAPVASKMAEGSLGSFAGVTSKAVNTGESVYRSSSLKGKLSLAQEMEGDMASKDDIWKKTGWFRGADNRWRYEIGDQDMKLREGAFDKTITSYPEHEDVTTYSLKPSGLPPLKDNASLEEILSHITRKNPKQLTLEKIIDHPELFKAYPELRGMKIKELPQEEIELGTKGMLMGGDLYLAPDLHTDYLRGVIMHEVQHKIQGIEGFSQGGSSGMFRPKGLDEAEEYFKKVRTTTEKDIVASGYTPEDIANLKAFIYDSLKDKPINPEVKSMLEKAKNSTIYKQLRNIVQAEIHLDDAQKEHHALYKRLRGEVEARNVQARLDYEEKTRQLIHPFRTEDYPRFTQNEPPPPWGEGPMKSIEVKPGQLPEGYYDKVPQEMRLSRSGTEPSHPGYRWEVYDPGTNKTMRKDIMTRVGASRTQDNLDNKYGGYKYRVRMVKASNLTDNEAKFLKENNINIPREEGSMKSEGDKPIPFRRAANDNVQKIPPREPNITSSKETIAEIEASWKKMIKMQDIQDKIDSILYDKKANLRTLTEFENAQVKKLAKELKDIYPK